MLSLCRFHPELIAPPGTALQDFGSRIRRALRSRKPDTTHSTFLAEHCGLLACFWQDRSANHDQTLRFVHAQDFTRSQRGRGGVFLRRRAAATQQGEE